MRFQKILLRSFCVVSSFILLTPLSPIMHKVSAVSDIKLNVPYFDQNVDNPSCGVKPNNTGCAITSIAMVLKYFGANATPEKVYHANDDSCFVNWYGILPTEVDPAATNITFDAAHDNYLINDKPQLKNFIIGKLNAGIPVIMGTDNFRSSGIPHWLVIKGYTADQSSFYVNNPYDGIEDMVTIDDVQYIKLYNGPVPSPIINEYTQESLYADFNGDGKMDMAITSKNTDNSLNWYVLTSDATKFNYAGLWGSSLGHYGSKLLAGRFNDDNKTDIAIGEPNQDGTLTWYVLLSDGTKFNYAGVWMYSSGRATGYQFAGKFNNDNRFDIVSADLNTDGTLSWYVFTSDGTKFNYAGAWASATGRAGNKLLVGNFTVDPTYDIAIGEANTDGTLKWYLLSSDGTKFNYKGIWANGLGRTTSKVFAGDFNGDGKQDIVLAEPNADNTLNWSMLKSTGYLFSYAGTWMTSTGRVNDKIIIGNLNIDGAINKADVVIGDSSQSSGYYNWYGILSDGTKFNYAGLWNANSGRISDRVL
jgi:hypothetical protein